MCRKWMANVGTLSLLVALTAAAGHAQNNPSGWIQTRGWNMLLPLGNPAGCAGGAQPAGAGSIYNAENMKRNWVAPHVIAEEDPRAGNVWADIDFGNTAAAAGFNGGGIVDRPTWVSNAFLDQAFMAIPTATPFPNGDVVDFQALIDRINNVVRPAIPGATNLAGDNVLGIATTYVRNLTGGPLAVDVCSASDDSVQVWVNNKLITNVSACRGTAGSCAELRRAILPDGVSKISVLVWEGGGGWGFRLGLRLVGGLANLRDDSAVVEFLGTGEPNDRGQLQYCLDRLAAVEAFNCPNFEVKVTLKGSGPGAAGDMLTVKEVLSVSNPGEGLLTTSGISHGGTASDEVLRLGEGLNAAGFVNDLLFLGPFANPGGAGPGDAELQAVQIRSTTDATLDESLATYRPRDGDTVPDNVRGIVTTNCGNCATINPGGVLRWNLRTNVANFDFNANYYGGDVDNCIAAVAFYVCLEEAKTVFFGVGSDDSFSIRVNGAVVGFRNIPRGAGAANEIQDLVGPVMLSAGKHFVLYKVYEGGGGHGGRIGLFNADLTPLQGATYTTDPDGACRGILNVARRRTITWNVSRGEANDGLMYTLRYGARGNVTLAGGVEGENVTEGPTSLFFDPQSGPVGDFANHHDIGHQKCQGSTTYDSATDTYTLVGCGDDIWDGGDEFHFAYKPVSGDFEAMVRVKGWTEPSANGRWGKHGIMARNTCDRNSRYSMIQANLATNPAEVDTPRHAFRLVHLVNGNNRDYYQVDDGALPGYNAADPLTVRRRPPWMRMIRRGPAIYTYLSFSDANGQPLKWCLVGSDNDPARPATMLVGMALTSHAGAITGGITFDSWSCKPLDKDCVDFEPLRFETAATGTAGVGSVPYTPRLVTARIAADMNGDGIPDAADAIANGGAGLGVKNRNWVWTDLKVGSEDLAGTLQVLWNNENRNFNPDGAGMAAVTPLLRFSFSQVARVFIAWDRRHVRGGTAADNAQVVASGWFDVNNDVGTLNAQGWLRIGGSSLEDPNADVIRTNSSAEGGDDAFAQGGVWCKDFGPGDVLETFQTGVSGGRSPYVVFIRCGQTCSRGDELASLGYDSPDDLGVIVQQGAFRPAVVEGRLRITQQGTGDSANAVWYGVPADPSVGGAPLAAEGFFAEFDIFMTRDGVPTNPDANPADGMTFAVVSTGADDALASAIAPFPPGLDVATLRGGAGGALGYEAHTLRERTECHPSFAIEADNWVGGGEPGTDPGDAGSPNFDGNWHIGVNVNASVSSIQTNVGFGVPTGALPYIFSPQGVHVEVMYKPDGSIDVWVTGVDRNGDPVPRRKVLSTQIPPLPAADLVLGFTGGTGGATCTQEVDNFRLSSLCCEIPDAVTIHGPSQAEQGASVTLSAVTSGFEHAAAATYDWEVASGSGTLSGSGPSVSLSSNVSGDVVVRVTAADGACDNTVSAEHRVTFACPAEGDTHCLGLVISGPAGNIPGTYTATASAADDSGDAIIYTFTASSGAGPDIVVGPQASNVASFKLGPGSWTISVTVDDDPDCPDVAADATCTESITVGVASEPFIRGDCNQDGTVCGNVSDIIRLIDICFTGLHPMPSCPAACDANGDGRICKDPADIIYLVNFCFTGLGGPPPAPFPACGVDAEADCDGPTFCAP
jgi:hypothetical protein